jgi:hypothetical protein
MWRSVNRTGKDGEAALDRPRVGANLSTMSENRLQRQEVAGLINRIKTLEAERRRLEGAASRELRRANQLEIARLQRRLATAVGREPVD